jgi:hypothetical protein
MQTGNWEDAASLRVTALPVIILALESAHTYATAVAPSGEPAEDEHLEEARTHEGNGTPPS